MRERTEGDVAACIALLRGVHAADGYPLFLAADDLPGYFAAGDSVGAWVAEVDGAVVGHVALQERPGDPTVVVAAPATGRPEAELVLVARLYVDPGARRSGLARTLLRHATAEAAARGRRAVLDVGQPFTAAVALYEAEGWTRVGELHLPLDEHGGGGPSAGPVLDLWVYASPEPG